MGACRRIAAEGPHLSHDRVGSAKSFSVHDRRTDIRNILVSPQVLARFFETVGAGAAATGVGPAPQPMTPGPTTRAAIESSLCDERATVICLPVAVMPHPLIAARRHYSWGFFAR